MSESIYSGMALGQLMVDLADTGAPVAAEKDRCGAGMAAVAWHDQWETYEAALGSMARYLEAAKVIPDAIAWTGEVLALVKEKAAKMIAERPAGPRYPEVVHSINDEGGNAFTVIGAVTKAMRSHGDGEEAAAFVDKAMSQASYTGVIELARKWITIP